MNTRMGDLVSSDGIHIAMTPEGLQATYDHIVALAEDERGDHDIELSDGRVRCACGWTWNDSDG